MDMKTIVLAIAALAVVTAAVNAENPSPWSYSNASTGPEVGATILSPIDGERYGNTSVIFSYIVAGDVRYNIDGGENLTLPANNTVLTILDDGLIDGGQPHTLQIVNASDNSSLASVNFRIDITAPANVTDLTPSAITTSSINWTWTNPTNTDFNNTRVFVNKTSDGTVIYGNVVVPKTQPFFLASGLASSTEYTIAVRTEDDAPAP